MRANRKLASKAILCAAAMLMFTAWGQDNLLKTGLKGWRLYNRKAAFDSTEKVTGNGSLRLENNSGAQRKIKLEPNALYRLSFSVKGKDISEDKKEGARLHLYCDNVKKWFLTAPVGKGTFDWKNDSVVIDTSKVGGTDISVLFKLNGGGTVWLDDIKLTKLTKLPAEWQHYNPNRVSADSVIKMSEDYSIRLDGNPEKSRLTQIEKIVDLEPGVQYELTFFMKGKGITVSSRNVPDACMLVNGVGTKRYVRIPVDARGGWGNGTFDWKQGKLKFTNKYFGADKITIILRLIGKGTAWFDKIEIRKLSDLNTNTSFRQNFSKDNKETVFYPLGVAGFFLPDEPIRFELASVGKGKAVYTVRLKDFSGKNAEITRNGEMNLPGKAQIDFPRREAGYYVAEAEIFINGKRSHLLQAGAAVAPEIEHRDPFFQMGFGVYPELYDAYKRIGVGAIALRLTCEYTLKPGKTKVEDRIERDLKSSRIFLQSNDFYMILSISNSLAKSDDPKYVSQGRGILNDAYVDNIIKGLQLMAEKTKGKIKEWNIGCEITTMATSSLHCGTWSEAMFCQMVLTRIASRVVRKIDPGIKIYFGGNNLQQYSNYEKIVFGDLIKEVDGYYIDGYPGPWNMMLGSYAIPEKSLRSFYEEASEMARFYGKDPIIKNNESGYGIHYGARFDRGIAVEQAALTARAIILTKAAPAVRSFELHMPTFHYGLKNKKDNSPIMTTVWKPILYSGKIYEIPLPGGAMYATVARELAFAKIHKELIVGTQYACIFTRPDGNTVAAVWNTETPVDLKINLKNPARLISMIGSESPLKQGENSINVSPNPVYLVTAEKPETIAEALQNAFDMTALDLKCAAKRHDLKTDSLFILNPGGKTVNVELIADGRKLKNVNAFSGKINVFRIPVCQNLSAICNGKTYTVKPDNSVLNIACLKNKPVFDGSGKWLVALKPGQLRYPNDIYPKSALHPELCYFRNSFNPNGHNVSADYYLAYDAENLYLAVKVDDPVHIQTSDNGHLWEGDSIQWVISTSDVPPKEVRSRQIKDKDIVSNLNFGLALTAKGLEYRRYLGKPGVLKYDCNVTRKGNLTFYEAAVPWSELGVKPDSGKILRFGLVVFDKNSRTMKNAPYHLAITPGGGWMPVHIG